MAIQFLLIAISLLFTFVVPGFALIETFFSKMSRIYKVPLYFLISVIFSTYLVYFLSLSFGYSKYTIAFSYLVWSIWLLILFAKNKKFKVLPSRLHLLGIIFSLLVFVIFVVSLYPAIFYPYKDYFVMSADNWQDTAMHMSIIQTISQGNFPPQAPYFSGHPLSYYYFSNFHTAILVGLINGFIPRILILDNSLFAATFALSVYALCFYFTKEKRASLISSALAVFGGSFMFINFFKDLALQRGSLGELLATASYAMEYGKLFQVTPMVDYFLQNRPMMVGLPAITLVTLLIINAFEKKNIKKILMASLITALLFKFQLFALATVIVIFLLAGFLWFDPKNIKKWVFLCGSFAVSIILFILIIYPATQPGISFIQIFKSSFSFGSWDKTRDFFWFVKFGLANFGALLFLFFVFCGSFFTRRIKISRKWIFLIFWAGTMFSIPFIVRFTIYEADMFKFFYIMTIPLSIIGGLILSKISRAKAGFFVVFLVITFASATSILTLLGSLLNRNFAYSMGTYKAGLWIRENTPKNSVFITEPTVHSATSDIGGRLRILSYINWPHSHGFNQGPDNVFSRLEDVDSLYSSQNDNLILSIVRKYKINYIYYGPDEMGEYPSVGDFFEGRPYLEKVYDLTYNNERIRIYGIKKI